MTVYVTPRTTVAVDTSNRLVVESVEQVSVQVPVLDSAVWRVDAGSLTDAEDGLADLSGNGRDAIFGAGSAAPKVLPHDDEDYIYFPGIDGNYGNFTVLGQDTDIDLTMDVLLPTPTTGTYRPLIYSVNGVRTNIYNTGRLTWVVKRADGTMTGCEFTDLANLDQRHTFRFTYTTATGDTVIYRDGVQVATGTGTPGVFLTSNASHIVGSTGGATGNSLECRLYSLHLSWGDTYICLPQNHDAGYTRIVDAGTSGDDLVLSRASSGYKTAVVDRPLLLFGGGQHTESVAPWADNNTSPTPVTVLMAWRGYNQVQNLGRLFNATNLELYHADPAAVLRARVGSGSYPNGDIPPDGEHVYGLSWSEVSSRTTLYLDGALVSQGTTNGIPTGNAFYLASRAGYTEYDATGELLAAAIFDVALSDAEIAQATEELLGTWTPRTIDTRPVEVQAVTGPVTTNVLRDAVWHVDAGTVDTDRLTDLSGGGRDAIFGAGAAAPTVLPWDGEDYVWFPDTFTDFCQTDNTAILRVGSVVTVDASFGPSSTNITHIASAGGTSDPTIGVSQGVGRVFVTGMGTAPGNLLMFNEFPDLRDGVRRTISVELGLTSVTVTVDGTPVTKPWNTTQMTDTAPWQWMTGNRSMTLYHLDIDGKAILDPSNVSADYSTITNTGTAGGDWTINRAASGYKTAVVDRSLLLFGEPSYAMADGVSIEARTVVMAFRLFSETQGSKWIYLGDMIGGSDGGAWWTFSDTPRVNMRNTLAAGGTVSRSTPDDGFGQMTLASQVAADNASLRTYRDGVYSGALADTFVDPVATRVVLGGTLSTDTRGMEFIAAAIFDRALTDTEILHATAELLGTPIVYNSFLSMFGG